MSTCPKVSTQSLYSASRSRHVLRRGHTAFRWRVGACFLALSVLVLNACGDDERYASKDRALVDADGDGWPGGLDCDDQNPRVFPAADEVAGDGIDQDCSGSDFLGLGGGAAGKNTGENPSGGRGGTIGGSGGRDGVLERGRDADGDGFAAVPEGTDCDDDRLWVYPGAPEVPLNGVDENCDGSDLVGVEQLVFPLSDEALPQEPPVVARSKIAGKDRLLVVWSDSRRAPGQDLYGQLTDGAGVPLGDEILLDRDNFKKTGVRIATKGDGFLVTWVSQEGLWVRQLAADGTPDRARRGFGAAGAVAPAPAYSAGHWAVAWSDGQSGRGWIRAMTLEGAPGDVVEIVKTSIARIALTGRKDDFVLAWDGRGEEGESTLWVQARTLTGYYDQAPQVVQNSGFVNPSLAWDGERVLLTFNPTQVIRSVFGLTFDQSLLQVEDKPIRLSSETPELSRSFLGGSKYGFFVAWDDKRHTRERISSDAIYGNSARISGKGKLVPRWPAARAQVVGTQTYVGGISVGEEGTVLSLMYNSRGALHFTN